MGKIIERLKQHRVAGVVISVFDWYPSHYPAEERRLLRKLDLAILIYGSISFFCRFLGQQNVTNAYVAGMQEDLSAYGNELNYYKMAYNTAYVLGQIPLMTLQTKARLAPYLIPTLQIAWAIIAFSQSAVTQNWHLYVLRALTGFLEACSFGGTHLILGSWFRNEEVFKRAGVWFMGNSLGSMFSGYFSAAATRGLNGVTDRAGWRWLFIIQGIITLPTAFLGFAFWPGLPISPRRWYLTPDEHALAVKRIPVVEKEGITWKTVIYTLKRPIFLCCAQYWTTYMALWLKAEKYTSELSAVLPTFIDLIKACSSWLGTTLAGVLSLRALWTMQYSFVVFAIIVFTIWNVPQGLKFAAWYFGGLSGMASPILYTWVNDTLRENYGERGLIISSMMTMGFAFQIWVPLLMFPAVEATRWSKGYPAAIALETGMWASLMIGYWYIARYKRTNPDLEMRLRAEAEAAEVKTEGGGLGVSSRNGSVSAEDEKIVK